MKRSLCPERGLLVNLFNTVGTEKSLTEEV